MKKRTYLTLLFITTFASTFAGNWTLGEVRNIIEKVNNTWQINHPKQERSFWDPAVYHTGNMEAYKLLGNKAWLDYSLQWAQQNQWMGAREHDSSRWKYKQYGEGQDYVLFGDWQICFQTYLDLAKYTNADDAEKYGMSLKRVSEVMDYEVNSGKSDYWWWADALYMVMPVFSKLYASTYDTKYIDQMYANWQYANEIMYDKEVGFYYRDGKYIYPKHTTNSGKKDFWARGDGWVMAAFAKVIDDLDNAESPLWKPGYRPASVKKVRAEVLTYYKNMAAAVKRCQQSEGYWTRSLLDPEQAPGRETSGTALFCYALFYGLNHGLLPAKEYAETAERAWDYLGGTALQMDGTVGYVQPIGEKAIPGQVVGQKSVTNFGTGAFLLAACEYYRYLERAQMTSQKGTNRSVKGHKSEGNGYLMVYHKDDDHSLHMATSRNGRLWTAVNDDKAVIGGDTIAMQHGIRDPHIFRGPDGGYYVAMTDLHIFASDRYANNPRFKPISEYHKGEWDRDGKLYGWGNNKGLVLMKSYDLINWTRTVLDFSKLTCPTGITDMHGNPTPWSEVGCVWAPEIVYDDEAGQLMIHFTTRMKTGTEMIYYAYVNRNFNTLMSDPKLLFEAPHDKNGVPAYTVIDSDIIKFGGKYHMFFCSHEHNATIKHATSDHITGPYVPDNLYDDGEKQSHEAPNCWKIEGEGKYVVMFDNFNRRPCNFGFVETSDFKTFTMTGYFDDENCAMKRTNFTQQKHGAVITLPVSDIERLEKYWKN